MTVRFSHSLMSAVEQGDEDTLESPADWEKAGLENQYRDDAMKEFVATWAEVGGILLDGRFG